MKISEWLFKSMGRLGEAGVDSPRRDALVLLEDTIRKDRSWVLAHSDFELNKSTLDGLEKLIIRRINREPLAYIRGKVWFYGRFFKVNEHVLIPRPETEDMIEFAKILGPKTVVEIGTGSGCIAVTLALELPDVEVMATDISDDCLIIARKNAEKHDVNVTFVKADLLNNLLNGQAPDLLMANLPYVPSHLVTSPEITKEPKIALFAGEDGLDTYKYFWQQLGRKSAKPKYVLTESLKSQHNAMIELAIAAGYKHKKTERLIQQFMI